MCVSQLLEHCSRCWLALFINIWGSCVTQNFHNTTEHDMCISIFIPSQRSFHVNVHTLSDHILGVNMYNIAVYFYVVCVCVGTC